MKIGRNDPCPCGSKKKHKKCCLGKPTPKQSTGVKVVTYATYEEIFGEERKDKLDDYLNVLPTIDLVCEYSFINMVMQTTDYQECKQLQIEGALSLYEDEEIKSNFERDDLIVITRDSVLYLLAESLLKNQSESQENKSHSSQKLFETLLLANSDYGDFQTESDFELYRGFIRNPDFMNPEATEWYFKHNFLRYEYIYENLVKDLNTSDQKFWHKVGKTF